MALLQALAKRHEIVSMDLAEVAPDDDDDASHSQSRNILAAQALLTFLGFVFPARASRQQV